MKVTRPNSLKSTKQLRGKAVYKVVETHSEYFWIISFLSPQFRPNPPLSELSTKLSEIWQQLSSLLKSGHLQLNAPARCLDLVRTAASRSPPALATQGQIPLISADSCLIII